MQNLTNMENDVQVSDDLIPISKQELRSLYRRIIECEKIIEEYKNKEMMQRAEQPLLSVNE